MLSRTHVPWAGLLVFGFAITALAQRPPAPEPTPADTQRVQALLQSGASAVMAGDSTQARDAYTQLLAIGRKDGRPDLVWQAQHGLGRAALAAHDPLAAIGHLEQSVATYEQLHETPRRLEPYHSLTTALMMQSSAPGDQFVQRAFAVAARAKTDQPERLRPRAEIAAAMRPGDMVVTFLVGETHAYGWAFDRDALIGYPLPPPAEIATAVERVNGYVAQKDRGGVQRIAEELLPALLGPVRDRLPTLTRVIFVMDGPLRQLAIGELPAGEDGARLSQRLAVSVVDEGALFDEIGRPSSPPPQPSAWPMTTIAAIAIVILLAAAAAALRRRSSVP